MHLRVHASPTFEPVPTWLVTNGEHTVGPVGTDLLVRGYLTGRIPGNCRVRSAWGGDWRALDEVREIRAAQRATEDELRPSSPRQVVRWLSDARDASEALALALHGACSFTHAAVGALYRVRPPLELPIVSAAYGDPFLSLGEVVPRGDPALNLAREGEPTVLVPDDGLAARAVTLRLSPDRAPAGLAIVPFRSATQLAGVVELARFDHPFRAGDVRSLVPLMVATLARLEELAASA